MHERVFWQTLQSLCLYKTATTTALSRLVKLYPNPVNDILSVEYEGVSAFTAGILDIHGRNIANNVSVGGKTIKDTKGSKQSVLTKKAIDVSSYKAGIYIVKIISDEGVAVKRFVKK